LIIFGLVNLANFKLRDKTNSNLFIPLLGFLLCFIAATILVGYNAKYSPDSLKSSLLVIIIVILFSFVYYKFGKKMQYILDEDLRKGN